MKTNAVQDKTVQHLSIHLLSLRKVCRYFSIEEAQADLLDLIDKVVALYNSTNKDNSYEEVGSQGFEHFQLSIFANVSSSQSRLSTWIQKITSSKKDLTTQRIHYLFFFYRQIPIKKNPLKRSLP